MVGVGIYLKSNSQTEFMLTNQEQKILTNVEKEKPLRFKQNRNEYMRNYLRIKRNTNPKDTKVIWRKNLKYHKDFQMCSVCHLVKFIKSNFYNNQYICKSCRTCRTGFQ